MYKLHRRERNYDNVYLFQPQVVSAGVGVFVRGVLVYAPDLFKRYPNTIHSLLSIMGKAMHQRCNALALNAPAL